MSEAYLPDYIDLHRRRQDEQEKELARLPKCEYCGEAIQEETLVDFDGCIICLDCFKSNHLKHTEDYIY